MVRRLDEVDCEIREPSSICCDCCREILENTNVTFNANNTVTYVPRRKVQAEPRMSVRDAHADRVIVPNVALLVSGAAAVHDGTAQCVAVAEGRQSRVAHNETNIC
jgi:hypothetical protein